LCTQAREDLVLSNIIHIFGFQQNKNKMAVSLYCPNCGENLGKDVECFGFESCGTCGETDIYNERGSTEGMDEEELAKFKKKKRSYNRNRFTGLNMPRRRW
jgi:predicted RNA-binding Zn-ribbon protein involved in translation (DUF1610 family)